MPRYEIVRPCAYVANGKAVLHKKPGKIVELSAEAAARLGRRVRLVPPPAAPPQPSPTPSTSESSKKGTTP